MNPSLPVDSIKITLTISPVTPWLADLLIAEMAGLGFDTFVETEKGCEAFIPGNLFDEKQFQSLLGQWEGDYLLYWEKEVIAAQNWNEEWEKNYFQPLVISDRVVVRAPFHTEYPPCPIDIVIEPKMAFGTGNHETTSLMMEMMLALPMQEWNVLDMGCGTGILAILAARLGAARITAIDNDPWSFQATNENILLNHTPEVTPLLGDASLLDDTSLRDYASLPGGVLEADGTPPPRENALPDENLPTEKRGPYHLILANIQKNVILSDLGRYAAVLCPGGHLLVSGFFTSDLPDISRQAATLGLDPVTSLEKNNWTAAYFRKKGIFVVT